MKQSYLNILLVFVLILMVITIGKTVSLLAQEGSIECNGDQIEFFEEDKRVVGSGNVDITYKDIKLFCDEVTVWTEDRVAEAEGNIRLIQGPNTFEGDTIRYNFQEDTGKVTNINATFPPWFAKGKYAQRVSKDKFIVNNGYLTTCNHAKPHWKISANKVSLYPEKKVSAYNGIAWVNPFSTSWDIPIFWIPYYSHPLDDNRPHVTVIPGRSSDWGAYLLTAWRYDLGSNQKGHVNIDYRERKDFASGIDYIYDTNYFGKGNVTTYYMRERQLGRDHLWDDEDEGDPTTEEEKALLRVRHQWQMLPSTLVTGELHKYRDKDLLKDYFFKEYEKDESPETYLLASHTTSFSNLSILTRKRMNRFDETVEKLPEATFDIYNLRLLNTQFYYKTNLGAANLNKVYPRHTDENPGTIQEAEHNNRYDSYNQLSYKSKLGFLYVTPYVGTRQTFYEREISSDESHLRGSLHTGVDVSTKFFKIFNNQDSPFGMEINKLRHIITPTFSYNYISLPTMLREKIFEFDSVDTEDRLNRITLSLENRLQTKRGKELQSVDLATLLLETDYDFNHTPGTQFLDHRGKLELKPFDWLTATSNVIIDGHNRVHHRWLKEFNNDLSFDYKDDWSIGVGHRYTQDSQNMVLHGNLNMIPGWRFSVYEDFDFKSIRNNEKKIYNLKEQEYVVTKDLHCWEMDVRYNVEREGGEEIMIVFRLKEFPDLPFEFGKNYHRPKIGSQSREY
ncbi:LPS-assembly protein LptD [Candidatus Omnitrophota bacterium]